MNDDDEDPYQGGGEAAGVWIFLQSCCSVGVPLLCGGVGGYSLHGTGHRGVLVPGGAETDGTDPAASGRQGVVVHFGGDIHPAEEEYGFAVH